MFGIVPVSALFDTLNIRKLVKYTNSRPGIAPDKELSLRSSCVNGEPFLNKPAGMSEYSAFDRTKRYRSVFSSPSIALKRPSSRLYDRSSPCKSFNSSIACGMSPSMPLSRKSTKATPKSFSRHVTPYHSQ